MKRLTIGLLGNPNSGKTTLFNQLTGLNQQVGNWPGVTVERQGGQFHTARFAVNLVDLPGTYSLTTPSYQAALDEKIVCQYVLSGAADLFISVLNAACLERNLYLTVQLLEMGIPCIIVLNMVDMAFNQGLTVDVEALSQALGVPTIALVATQAMGIGQLQRVIDDTGYYPSSLRIAYPDAVEKQVQRIERYLQPPFPQLRPRWLALQILEGDLLSRVYQRSQPSATEQEAGLIQMQQQIVQESGEEAALLIADARYRFIATVCRLVVQREQRPDHMTERLDRVVLNRWLGIPIFLCIMYLMFFFSMHCGGALQPLFSQGSEALFIHGVQWLGYFFHLPSWVIVVLAQGVGGGIHTVLPLTPQIGFMFLFLSFLEDSGYMARVAFVMDRFMQTLGLPGKSFVPLIVGFGCNVPAIMGARSLNTERDRLLTILITPFMACGARLAIFIVFASAFFGRHGVLIIFSLYLLGIIVAILSGLILKSTLMQGELTPFFMELPTYHRPHFKSLSVRIWHRLKSFIIRAGKTIILVNVIITILSSFSLQGALVGNDISHSALCTLGRRVTPLLSPIGITEANWPATVGLVTGAIAKEVVIGTLNTLYSAEQLQGASFDPEQYNLLGALRTAWWQSVQNIKECFGWTALEKPHGLEDAKQIISHHTMGVMAERFNTPTAAYSYLIFVLLYVPCISTIGAIGRESGRKWMLFSLFWGLNVAYSLATFYYQVATFTLHPIASGLIIALIGSVNAAILLVMRRMQGCTTPGISSKAIQKQK